MIFDNSLRILDGGSGFEALELCSGKIDIRNHPCWSARLLYDDQSMVREVYQRFLHAGAEVITSLSYQAHPESFSRCFNVSLAEAEQLMIDSVLLAKDEIRQFRRPMSTLPIICAASIGPYGAYLADGSEYSGSYMTRLPLSIIEQYIDQQISILARSEPDCLAFETVPTLAELKLIIDLMRARPSISAWVSMSTVDDRFTVGGDDLMLVVDYFNKYATDNIFAFGVNCVMPLQTVAKTIRDIRTRLHPSKIVIVYPNNGELYDKSNDKWYFPDGVNEQTFYNELPNWIEEGARWIGGCCRMGSDKMRKVSQEIQLYREGI